MPRFYFDTNIHGEMHRDDEGEVYADPATALRAAKAGAAEYVADKIAHGDQPDHEEKLVRDENGHILARFMIYDAFGAALPEG